MIAETAFNVIEALDNKEKARLYRMLGVEVPKNKSKRKPIISDAESREKLMKYLTKNK